MKKVIQTKSFQFALRIVKLCNYLQTTQHEFIMARQLLRCGTSIGANVAESEHAQSRADFVHKLEIALKECSETEYWLELLIRKKKITDEDYKKLKNCAGSIRSRLIASITTAKANGHV